MQSNLTARPMNRATKKLMIMLLTADDEDEDEDDDDCNDDASPQNVLSQIIKV